MDEKMKKFIPLFVLIGLAIVAVAIYIIIYHVGMPTRDLSGAPARLLAWSMARSYCFLIIHSQLV